MEAHRIKKVSDSEIMDAAFVVGRKWVKSLSDSLKSDSIVRASAGRVQWVTSVSAAQHPMEKQILDAYQQSDASSLMDNVQKIRTGDVVSDSLLYSYPVTSKNPDGSISLAGVWNVWLSRKEIVLAMKKKK